jgi:hypothetical protein
MVLGLDDLTSTVHIKLFFYAVLAQVLPILLLAVVVESRRRTRMVMHHVSEPVA